jgi:hypothetical protein
MRTRSRTSRLSTPFGGLAIALFAGFLTLPLGCMSRPLAQGSSPPMAAAPGKPEDLAPNLKDQAGTRVLRCADDDGSSALYAVDDMTRKLARFPSLAAYVGLVSVSNCSQAISYARGYDEYSGLNPGFEGRPDPKLSGRSPVADKDVILPRIMVKNGAKVTDWAFPTPEHPNTNPGPIVRISPAYWWPNGKEVLLQKTKPDSTKCFVDQFCECRTRCTATFINRSWLLTAAHCVRNVNKMPISLNDGALAPDGKTMVKAYCQNKSVPVPGSDAANEETGDSQPFKPTYTPNDPRIGYAQYLISWPSTYFYAGDSEPDFISMSSEENYYGVGLYQYPHPDHDPTEDCVRTREPEDCGTVQRHGPDVALLTMASWTTAAEYMTPDLDKEGAMYIAGKSTSGPGPGVALYAAGYGDPPDNNAALYNGVVNQSNGTVTFMPGWADTANGNMFGGYGRVYMNVTRDSQTVTCQGDSGGPLYSAFTPSSGQARKFIEYAVLSSGSAGSDGCDTVGGSSSWSRLEADDRLIGWMNTTMSQYPVADNPDVQGKYNQCQPLHDSINGWYYKCWGDPCDDIEGSALKCDELHSCIGSGKRLNEQGRKCYGCRTAGNWQAGDCSCIMGYCMWDQAKLAAAAQRGAGGTGGGGGSGGAGGGGTP